MSKRSEKLHTELIQIHGSHISSPKALHLRSPKHFHPPISSRQSERNFQFRKSNYNSKPQTAGSSLERPITTDCITIRSLVSPKNINKRISEFPMYF